MSFRWPDRTTYYQAIFSLRLLQGLGRSVQYAVSRVCLAFVPARNESEEVMAPLNGGLSILRPGPESLEASRVGLSHTLCQDLLDY